MNTKHSSLGFGLALMMLSAGQALSTPAQVPPFLISGVESQVMINMSNDHQLFYKAYDDWSDIDGKDGVDITYKHSIDYFGYFDNRKCYKYNNSRFEPVGVTTDKYCDNVTGADWSGNFLNWATMTRIDTVRKILFGGKRSTDTGALTVLERAYLPGDAHSFAKYYQQASAGEMGKLTPWSDSEITICNTTYSASGDSEDITAPPLIRVASGNFALWAANERFQCHWAGNGESERDIHDSPNPNTNNGNHTPTTGLSASADNPNWTTDRLGDGDFNVRVKVCDKDVIGTESCKKYPDGNFKPIGLLQEYGDNGQIHFGLITGSYAQNKSGGVLRKNVGSIADEINVDTDGTFKAVPGAGNIISNLSNITISGYEHSNGVYNISDSCFWGLNSFANGNCSNWGNPQSEMYLESLRYFAGKTANFNTDDSSYVPGVVAATEWKDPLNNSNYCAPVSVIQFNASVTSYDDDELTTGAADLAGLGTVSTWTDKVGSGEAIAGEKFFVGSNGTDNSGVCTAKTLTNLSNAQGHCPEAPRLEGGFNIAGLAHYARTKSIRTDLKDVDNKTADIFVKTYGVSLSPAVPKIEVPIPGQTDKFVTILPACRNQSIAGNCAIVDFKVVQKHAETSVGSGTYTAEFYVNWEDSEQGGDYDQDMAGLLSYSISSTSISVTTSVFAESTGYAMAFGYIISGTTQDGFHAHSGINGFNEFDDPTGVMTCRDAGVNCNTGAAATTVAYTLGSGGAELLKDPLYYAAKWGGFDEEPEESKRPDGAAKPNGVPDQDYEWKNPTTGLPKSYFFSRNPGELNSQLANVFKAVATESSAASVVANSFSLQTSTRIYQARFNSSDWSGKLLSFPLDVATGTLKAAEWDAGVQIAKQKFDTERDWITWNGSKGVAFTWDDNNTADNYSDDTTELSENQRKALNKDISGNDDDQGVERLEFLRGDRSKEFANGGGFRNRSTPLGDIVHSTPTIVGPPSFRYRDIIPGTTSQFAPAKYSEFRTKYANASCFAPDGTPITSWTAGTGSTPGSREPMIYFGANDGALHAVSACSGKEHLAFVPNTVFPNLSELTSPSYAHLFYVDGAPTVVDAYVKGAWRTVLVGTLEAGGKGVFALDVTDPNNFSESKASDIVLWEKNNLDTGFGELGYTYSQPAIIKAEGHGWVAVFGNGYHGQSGHAILYIVNLENGTVIKSINLNNVDATAHGTGNGLSTVSPIDLDGDGDIDLIYAGDLNGNVWRFAAAPTTGFSESGTSLLFAAKNKDGVAQPITSRLAVGYHPTSAIGRMVYFGTGKYYERKDQDPDEAVVYNTMYGIWDRDTGTAISSVTTRTSAVLQKQEITTEQRSTFGTNSVNVRVVSNHSIKWIARDATTGDWGSCGSDASCGWYLDLHQKGEKMVATPILRGGRLIFVTTIPSLVPCEAGGTGWLMELDPRTGGRLDFPVFDLNGDTVFNSNDQLGSGDAAQSVSGKQSEVGILQPPAILAGIGGPGDGSFGNKEGKYASGSKDGAIEITIENPGGAGAGRKSWVRIK